MCLESFLAQQSEMKPNKNKIPYNEYKIDKANQEIWTREKLIP